MRALKLLGDCHKCLEKKRNTWNVGNKSVCLISFKSKVVCISRLYLSGSLLVGMHSCGLHVYDRSEVCGSERSRQSHRGVIGVSCQCVSSSWEMSHWHNRKVTVFLFLFFSEYILYWSTALRSENRCHRADITICSTLLSFIVEIQTNLLEVLSLCVCRKNKWS